MQHSEGGARECRSWNHLRATAGGCWDRGEERDLGREVRRGKARPSAPLRTQPPARPMPCVRALRSAHRVRSTWRDFVASDPHVAEQHAAFSTGQCIATVDLSAQQRMATTKSNLSTRSKEWRARA
eukprot:2971217-Rhodomonas_salina.2